MNSKHRKQAAEKRKREEAMQAISDDWDGPTGIQWENGAKEVEAVTQKIWPFSPRIWIGTGDAGEPNEQ